MWTLVLAMTVTIYALATTAFADTPLSTILVPRDFPTIQAAVDAAAPGATINVRRGTYVEEVVIAKDVNLRGAGVGATTIKSPATLTPTQST